MFLFIEGSRLDALKRKLHMAMQIDLISQVSLLSQKLHSTKIFEMNDLLVNTPE